MNKLLVTFGQKKTQRTPSQRLAAVFDVEVDLGSDLRSLCGLNPLDGDQSCNRYEEERIGEAAEHVFCRSKLQRGVVDLELGRF